MTEKTKMREAASLIFLILAILGFIYTLAEFLTSNYFGDCLGYCMSSNIINCQNKVLLSFIPKTLSIVVMIVLFYAFDSPTEPENQPNSVKEPQEPPDKGDMDGRD